MTKEKLNELYFNWLIGQVNEPSDPYVDYSELFKSLYEKDFIYLIDRDINRAEDGLALRKKFKKEYDLDADKRLYFDPCCTCMEAMVAIAINCEHDIMACDPDDEHPNRWFWGMIESLGLMPYDNFNFNHAAVDRILNRWLNREFNMDGSGSLFTIKHPLTDYRKMEIAGQMYHYLNELLANNF